MLQPENAAYQAEIGHQQALLSDYASAYSIF